MAYQPHDRLDSTARRDSLPQRTEKRLDLRRQSLWLFHRGEMAAPRHIRPALNVRIRLPGDGAGRADDLLRERRVAYGHIDRAAAGDRPLAMKPGIVRPERGPDRPSKPIQRHVRQQMIPANRGFQITAAIRPRAEFLRDPGQQPRRRIRQPVCQGLRLGALDPLVPVSSFSHAPSSSK